MVFVSLVHPLAAVRTRLPEVLQTTAGHGLTAEEMRLLQLMADGFSDQQVARLLGEPEDSVDQQVRALVTKMSASSRTEAVVLAFKKHVLL
jgi:two-component system response regulator DegU